jgi:hypothetical protein
MFSIINNMHLFIFSFNYHFASSHTAMISTNMVVLAIKNLELCIKVLKTYFWATIVVATYKMFATLHNTAIVKRVIHKYKKKQV